MLIRSGIPGNPPPAQPSLAAARRPLPRRRLLGLAAAITVAAGLTACTSPPPAAPAPLEPDEPAVNRAVDAARALRTEALALAGTRPELAALLARTAAGHQEHLVALGAPISAGTPTATGTTTPAATTTTAKHLIRAEIAASRIALRDGESAAPAFALLLCRIAAARIVNADLLSAAASQTLPGVLDPAAADTAPTTTSPVPTDQVTAAEPFDPIELADPQTPAEIARDRLLAGEHAAVFGYPLIISRVTGGRRPLAVDLWQAHRNERDELSSRSLNAGLRSAVAEPAYDLGVLPNSSAKAAALAARIEQGLARLAADLVAAGTAGDRDRALGAEQLILAARRTAAWTGVPQAFPGQATDSVAAAGTAPGRAVGSSSTGI